MRPKLDPAKPRLRSGGSLLNGYSSSCVRGSGNPTPSFSLDSGAQPPGLNLDHTTGVLGGTPTAAGAFTFVIRATNGVNPDALTAPIATGAVTSTSWRPTS